MLTGTHIDTSSRRVRRGGAVLVLVWVYLLMRLPGLREQSVFCDEATYLRWGQMIAQDPGQYLFISMEDAKLPLHYWLLALARLLSGDPVYAGRLLSVVFGALTIPAIFALCGELCTLAGGRRSLGPLTAAFMIGSPLMAINQRMALAEPLLLLEAVLLGWQSLRLARHIREMAGVGVLVRDAVWLGVLWGLALLTKQNFSYVLWALPPAALVITLRRGGWKAQVGAFVPRYAVATVIGLGCFVPVLWTSHRFNLETRLFYKPGFTDGAVSRWMLVGQNLRGLLLPEAGGQVRWWPYDGAGPLESGVLYLYLTPVVLVLALVAVPWMIARRRWGLLAFCGMWCAALLGSLVVGANILFSRYVLLGAFPLLMLAAWCAGEWCAALRGRHRMAAVGLLGVVFAWPMLATGRDVVDGPMLTQADRRQYVVNAGDAAQQAVEWLRGQAGQGPITVVTGVGLGLRNDYTWLMLSGRADVQLYCDDSMPPLRPSRTRERAYLAGTEQWMRGRIESVDLPAERPVYFLADGAYDPKAGEMDFMPRLIGPGSRLVKTFVNPPMAGGGPAESGIAIYRMTRPAGALEASAGEGR